MQRTNDVRAECPSRVRGVHEGLRGTLGVHVVHFPPMCLTARISLRRPTSHITPPARAAAGRPAPPTSEVRRAILYRLVSSPPSGVADFIRYTGCPAEPQYMNLMITIFAKNSVSRLAAPCWQSHLERSRNAVLLERRRSGRCPCRSCHLAARRRHGHRRRVSRPPRLSVRAWLEGHCSRAVGTWTSTISGHLAMASRPRKKRVTPRARASYETAMMLPLAAEGMSSRPPLKTTRAAAGSAGMETTPEALAEPSP